MLYRARHYSDLVITYLEGSYICEDIAAIGEIKKIEVDWNSANHPVAQFETIPKEFNRRTRKMDS